MRVTLAKVTQITPSIVMFSFAPTSDFRYIAGQFIELTVPHDNPDERGERRWFTLSSSPSDEFLTITTRFFGEQSSSFKQALYALPVGTELTMSEPMGDFVLPKNTEQKLIFVAGGIGITPYASMLKWLSAQEQSRSIKLLYAVRSEDDLIYTEVIKNAPIHATLLVDNPSDAWGGERGKLTADLVLGIEHPSPDTLIYLSGPEPLLEDLAKDLKAKGIAPRQIVTDFFPNYTQF